MVRSVKGPLRRAQHRSLDRQHRIATEIQSALPAQWVQLGADSTDIVMLVMKERGMNHLLSDKFSIGADLAVAAGPVGRDTAANTDVLMRAEILSWSRTHGVFAGAALNGTVVEHDEAETRRSTAGPTAITNSSPATSKLPKPQAASSISSMRLPLIV